MRLLVVQHDHASSPGHVAERFTDRGYDLTAHTIVPAKSFGTPGVTTRFPEFTGFDVVVLMGAPWSTYDHDRIGSWVVPEAQQVRRADAAGIPVLGICFGGQLLAETLGGAVTGSPEPEIGWTDVQTDDADVVPPGPWFQWHSDRWELPPAARELARNPAASQAFVLRRNLAVQFHPELTSGVLAGWLANGGDAKARAVGIDPDHLVSSTHALVDDARKRAHRLVDGFLDRVAPRVLD